MTEFKKLKPRFDRKTALEGIWVYPVDEADNEYGGFKVALYNQSFARIVTSAEKLKRLDSAAQRGKRGSDAKAETMRRNLTHFIESCLIDWDLNDENGKAIPFSHAKAVEYFMVSEIDEESGEREYVHEFVLSALMALSQDVTKFQSEEQTDAGDALGNSSPASTTK